MNDLKKEVIDFVENHIGVESISSQTTLFGDLHIDGDDALELMNEFGRVFDVDLSSFAFKDYFGREGFPIFQWFVYPFQRFVLKRDPHQVVSLNPLSIGMLVDAARSHEWKKKDL